LGYILSGGKFGIILHALPYEGMIIAGSAVGAYVVANSMTVIKQTLRGLGKVAKSNHWKAADFSDLLLMMYEVTQLKADNPVELGKSLEKPEESKVFSKYPRLLADHHLIDFICDTYRAMQTGLSDPFQVEEHMQSQIEKHHKESHKAVGALSKMADGLPALGIVAAVLGVIKTMSSIDQPPTILGPMIGGALVGTFLGVFLSYALVGPIAQRLEQIEDEDGSTLLIVSKIIHAGANKQRPEVCIEVGRGAIPTKVQPSFEEMDKLLEDLKASIS
jgi:chemotaxis protein MotA